MPAYPAMALLLGNAMGVRTPATLRWLKRGEMVLLIFWTLASGAIVFVLSRIWRLPTPGDISQALIQHAKASYTLSLGHMGDLTLDSFAYLRTPLILALIAFLLGLLGLLFFKSRRRFLSLALTMILFFHAARLAMVTFDPYLSSRALAKVLLESPRGTLISAEEYYDFSSVFFYTGMNGFLLNGRVNNLEYGSNAPGAPRVFVGDADLAKMWKAPERCYLLAGSASIARIQHIIAPATFTVVKESGGNYLLTNRPVAYTVGI